MSKENVEKAKKDLKESKSAGHALEILQKLRTEDPDTYQEMQDEPGN